MCVAAHSTVLLCVCSIFHSSVRLHSPFSKNISPTLLLYNFQLVNFNWEPNTQLTLDTQQSTKTCWTIFINNSLLLLTCFSCADIYLCFIDNLIRAQKFKAETFTYTKLQHCHFSLSLPVFVALSVVRTLQRSPETNGTTSQVLDWTSSGASRGSQCTSSQH